MLVPHRTCYYVSVPMWVYSLYSGNYVLNNHHWGICTFSTGIKMEIRDPEKLVKYITTMHQNPNVQVRIQDDGTIDLMLSETKRLEPAMESVKCPYCDILIREHQSQLGENIRGMYLRCPECNQRFFIHLFVPFGGTPI